MWPRMCYNRNSGSTWSNPLPRQFNEEQKRGRYEANKRRVKKLREQGGQIWEDYMTKQRISIQKHVDNRDPIKFKERNRIRSAKYREAKPEWHLYNAASSRANRK